MRSFQNRSVCRQTELSIENICELETRSIGSGNRRIPNALAESAGICFPTILPNRQLPCENTEGTSRDRDDNTTVASPNLVPHVIGDVHMLPNTVTTSKFPASVPSGSNPSPCSDRGITVGGLEVIGEGPGSTKIAEHAETLVRGARRPGLPDGLQKMVWLVC